MKVAIREQIDIEDDQRVKLADILDNKQSKRQATRDEIKDFAWALGAEWAEAMEARWRQLFGSDTADDETAESSPEPDPAPEGTPDAPAAEEAAEDEDLLGLSVEEAMEALL